jgi:glutamate synthase (NADPH/NADH) large chain
MPSASCLHAAGRELRDHCKEIIAEVIAAEGQVLIGFRDVPVDNSSLSKAPEIAATEPVTVRSSSAVARAWRTSDDFERRLFMLRKVISNRVYGETEGGDNGFYIVSLSTRTIVYKGMFLAYQVGAYYKDLKDERFRPRRWRWCTSASRPTPSRPGSLPTPTGWSRTMARSTRCAATSTGWRRARPSVDSELFGDDISKLWPISYEGQSDTACFDNALEFLSWAATRWPTP